MNSTPQPSFHAFTITFEDGLRARIITPVTVYPAFDPTNKQASPPGIEVNALWDTGATQSVITAETAQRLNLPVVGQVTMNHAGGSGLSSQYLINLILPNKVGFSGIMVSECANIVGSFGAIIGMDIITQGDLALTNHNNRTVMSFRSPSIQTIDYVQEANHIKYAGAARNGPCPCGKVDANGKPVKFKHCHGKTNQ